MSNILGGYIRAERDSTVKFPWGSDNCVIEVASMKAVESAEVLDFPGPGMNGYSNNTTSRPMNAISVRGKQTTGELPSQVGLVGIRVAVDIALGNGERWAGSMLISKSVWDGDYNTREAFVQLDGIFRGAVTRTPVGGGA